MNTTPLFSLIGICLPKMVTSHTIFIYYFYFNNIHFKIINININVQKVVGAVLARTPWKISMGYSG